MMGQETLCSNIIDQFLRSQCTIKKDRCISVEYSYCENLNQLLSAYREAYCNGRSTKQVLLFAADTIMNTLDRC